MKDGVYTAAQAAQGDALYQNRCVTCHGAPASGDAGPPLAGQSFLDVWGKLPLADLFDKIRNTMPDDAPGTLTGPQVADLIAYLLQANRFPAGRVELDASQAALRQISFPSVASGASSAAAAPDARLAAAQA